jgi:hypothetical protein
MTNFTVSRMPGVVSAERIDGDVTQIIAGGRGRIYNLTVPFIYGVR